MLDAEEQSLGFQEFRVQAIRAVRSAGEVRLKAVRLRGEVSRRNLETTQLANGLRLAFRTVQRQSQAKSAGRLPGCRISLRHFEHHRAGLLDREALRSDGDRPEEFLLRVPRF